jgi:ribosome recycling factor
MVANIGFNPMNNGDLIIISVPINRRKETRSWKTSKVEAEDAKVGIRNARKDANTEKKN